MTVKLLTPYERFRQGLITRDEYITQTGLIDSDYTKEKAHMVKLAHNTRFGWLVRYAQKIVPSEDWMIDDIVDMAYDCRQLKNDPGIPSLDFHSSYAALLDAIETLQPPVPQSQSFMPGSESDQLRVSDKGITLK